MFSVKHNNIFFHSTYWQQVSVIRTSSGHHNLKFKTGYMCTTRNLYYCFFFPTFLRIRM